MIGVRIKTRPEHLQITCSQVVCLLILVVDGPIEAPQAPPHPRQHIETSQLWLDHFLGPVITSTPTYPANSLRSPLLHSLPQLSSCGRVGKDNKSKALPMARLPCHVHVYRKWSEPQNETAS